MLYWPGTCPSTLPHLQYSMWSKIIVPKKKKFMACGACVLIACLLMTDKAEAILIQSDISPGWDWSPSSIAFSPNVC